MVDSRVNRRVQDNGNTAAAAVSEKNKRSETRNSGASTQNKNRNTSGRNPQTSGVPKAVRKPPEFKPQGNPANTASQKNQAKTGAEKKKTTSSANQMRQDRTKIRENPQNPKREKFNPSNENVKKQRAGSEVKTKSPPKAENIKINQKSKEIPKTDTYRKYMANLRKSKLVRIIFLTCMMLLLIFILSAIIYELFFKITEIEVTGLTKYSEKEIISISGAEEGKNLYSFNIKEAIENITMYYPFVKSVTVTRSLPNKVSFSIVEENAVFYADIFGEIYLFSGTMRVLGKGSKYTTDGLIELKLPLVNYAVAGNNVSFLEPKNEKYIKSTTSDTIASPMADRVNIVDLRNKYNMTMVIDRKYRLIFGTTEEVLLKLKLAEKVFQDSMFTTGNKAIVDLTKLNETSVIIDNTISLD